MPKSFSLDTEKMNKGEMDEDDLSYTVKLPKKPKTLKFLWTCIFCLVLLVVGLFIAIAYIPEIPSSMILPLGGILFYMISSCGSEIATIHLNQHFERNPPENHFDLDDDQDFPDFGVDKEIHRQSIIEGQRVRSTFDKYREIMTQKAELIKKQNKEKKLMKKSSTLRSSISKISSEKNKMSSSNPSDSNQTSQFSLPPLFKGPVFDFFPDRRGSLIFVSGVNIGQ